MNYGVLRLAESEKNLCGLQRRLALVAWLRNRSAVNTHMTAETTGAYVSLVKLLSPGTQSPRVSRCTVLQRGDVCEVLRSTHGEPASWRH